MRDAQTRTQFENADGLIGRRVRLIHCTDPYTKLAPGEEGTIRYIDAIGTVFINWDSGSHLGLVPGEDSWETLSQGGAER